MTQCKRDGCREQAVATGKRLCPAHTAALKARRAKYERDGQNLPLCCDCGVKRVRAARIHPGKDALLVPISDRCQSCSDRNVQKSADDLKAWQFDQAETVEQLKDWLREYLP